MPPSEIKKDARASLKGKWVIAISITLLSSLFSFLITFAEKLLGDKSLVCQIISLIFLIISVPLSFGLIISFIKLKREESVKIFDFIKNGFINFGKSWGIAWHMFIRLLLPILCLCLVILLIAVLIFISVESPLLSLLGIVLYLATLIYFISRSFLYILSYYIAYDNPQLSSKECVKKSEKLMKGNRGNYLLLQLSFIGWYFLVLIVCFILFILISIFYHPLMAIALTPTVISPFLFSLLTPYISMSEVCFYDRIVKTDVKKSNEEVKTEE